VMSGKVFEFRINKRMFRFRMKQIFIYPFIRLKWAVRDLRGSICG
jgi:hypothetical protein